MISQSHSHLQMEFALFETTVKSKKAHESRRPGRSPQQMNSHSCSNAGDGGVYINSPTAMSPTQSRRCKPLDMRYKVHSSLRGKCLIGHRMKGQHLCTSSNRLTGSSSSNLPATQYQTTHST
ncbi:hypothetical protein PGT21_032349 [Puccinia graminis f. sp. tritici]|uniref:Uncharacterized protein n=1 Tax=Puccinia graminis f. sp. tritici TaxID=56615 RepID=A0A5B0QQK1_PUCGR|nr:hypothetical protein PGT21_032349 [Puccinia graminis f. sp. tritici]